MIKSAHEKHAEQPEASLAKYRVLHDLGARSGSFVAPGPLWADRERSVIGLEFIENLVPLSHVLPELPLGMAERLLFRIGSILAQIHDGLTAARPGITGIENLVPDIEFPFCAESGTRRVVVHGDFGLGNLHCVAGDIERLVVLDPEPAPYLNFGLWAHGPPCFDAAHLAGALEGVFPPKYYLRYRWNAVPQYRRAVFEGYGAGAAMGVTDAEFEKFTGQLLGLFASWLQGPGHSRRNRALGWFLGRRAARLFESGGN